MMFQAAALILLPEKRLVGHIVQEKIVGIERLALKADFKMQV